MKIAVAHIIYHKWYHDMLDSNERKNITSSIISDLPSVDLLVFPAGYLMCNRVKDCDKTANRFLKNLPHKHPYVIFGVDCRRSENDYKGLCSPPYFGYVVSNSNEKVIWGLRQQGTSAECYLRRTQFNSNRYFTIKNKTIALIICGEMTTRFRKMRLSKYVAKKEVANKKVDLVVDISHANKRIKPPRWWLPAMKEIGKPCVVSEHIGESFLGNGHLCPDKKVGPPNLSYELKLISRKKCEDYYLNIFKL